MFLAIEPVGKVYRRVEMAVQRESEGLRRIAFKLVDRFLRVDARGNRDREGRREGREGNGLPSEVHPGAAGEIPRVRIVYVVRMRGKGGPEPKLHVPERPIQKEDRQRPAIGAGALQRGADAGKECPLTEADRKCVTESRERPAFCQCFVLSNCRSHEGPK